MIQRIQTLYLLLAAGLVACAAFLPLASFASGGEEFRLYAFGLRTADVDAVHAPIPARSVDGVKRRTAAGMGRCQGGFCSPRVAAILAREWGVPLTAIEQDHPGSRLLTGQTKDPAKGGDDRD